MPGVPSGRGCDVCRKQRKKCDQKKPACSRCERLKVVCQGAGQQRFKWHIQCSDSVSNQIVELPERYHSVSPIPKSPSNEHSLLLHEVVTVIDPTTDVRFNLLSTYGSFLGSLPQRLGMDPSLDAAAAALVAAHADYCLHSSQQTRSVSIRTLQRNGDAIKALRAAISSPDTASRPSTLCAIYLLLIIQRLMGNNSPIRSPICWSMHSAGALEILRHRDLANSTDDFQQNIIMSVQGVVMIASIFDSRVKLTRQERQDFRDISFPGNHSGERLWMSLAKAPDVMAWIRESQGLAISIKVFEIRQLEAIQEFKKAETLVKDMYTRLCLYEDSTPCDSAIPSLMHLTYQKRYGLSLLAIMIWLCILKNLESIGLGDPAKWEQDTRFYARRILDLAVQSCLYRPVGSRYILQDLLLTYATVDDIDLRAMIVVLFEDFRRDCPCCIHKLRIDDWSQMIRHLRYW